MTDPALNFGDVLPATVGHPREYFRERRITLDCRGPLVIHRQSCWGPGVVVLTQSHDLLHGVMGHTIPYGVRVDAWAWICGYALLAGCRIGEKAVVAAGTVVRGQDVAPGVMVAGNPARIVARWDAHYRQWVYVEPAESGYEKVLA